MTNEETLHALIDGVNTLGLSTQDVHEAEVMLDYREYELAFDLVLHQLHAHHIRIKAEQLALIQAAARRLHIPETNYEFVHQLLR